MSLSTERPTVEEILSRHYPVEIHYIDEGDGAGYYFAFLPDFGHSACSATGDTTEEAIASLDEVKEIVVRHYVETGKPIPEPAAGPNREAVVQQMPLRVPKDIHDRLKRMSRESGVSLNAYVVRVLSEHIASGKTMELMEARVEKLCQSLSERIACMAPRQADWGAMQYYVAENSFGPVMAFWGQQNVQFLGGLNDNSLAVSSPVQVVPDRWD